MLILCLVCTAQAEWYLNVDEDLNAGAGYINVYSADGTTWVQGFSYPNADLRANSTGSTAGGDFQVLLQANTLLYTANLTNPYWVVQPSGPGNKQPEANYYHEKDGWETGDDVVFEYRVVSNNLSEAGYDCRAFIKVLDAGGGWATTTYEWADLTVGPKTLRIPGSAVVGADPRVQAGFSVKGLNVNSTDPIAALGIVVVPYYSKAVFPNPADGASVGLDLTNLSWTNADPNNPADKAGVTCNVYFKVDDGDPNFLAGPIATGITNETIALADYSITLADETTYVWRVDCIDPNTGGSPRTIKGDLWTFTVTDVPPAANAGADKFLWLSMPDGDGDPAKVTFTVTGTYTDDNKSPITRAEWVQGVHEGGGTVTKVSETWTPGVGSGTVSATFSATDTGWLFLTLEVQDSAGTGADLMNTGVYGTCAQAATEDPDDTYDATGDLDGNCKKDLNDFAIFAAGWLDCDANKITCP